MARLNVGDESVRDLIDNRLVPLFKVHGSIIRVAGELNARLAAAGLPDRVHANRLSPLYANDLARGINDKTYATIRLACDLPSVAAPTVPPCLFEIPPAVASHIAQARLNKARNVLTTLALQNIKRAIANGPSVEIPSRVAEALVLIAETQS